MCFNLYRKSFSFELKKSLHTSQGIIKHRQGWLICLESNSGKIGWGEISPFNPNELKTCEKILQSLGSHISRQTIEQGLKVWPGSLGFGFGGALAEIDYLVGIASKTGWLKAPKSAVLLPSGPNLISALDSFLKPSNGDNSPITFKWKVALESDSQEQKLLQCILGKLPENSRLRLDANGGWDRERARSWLKKVKEEPRIEWLEQPLPKQDLEGLWELAKEIPVALDESLLADRSLIESWPGWQVRRPALEGDPRILLKQLETGVSHRMLSTAFETGIGQRWVHHFSALQQRGPTPTAPGLAPGWCTESPLFSSEPETVWKAA